MHHWITIIEINQHTIQHCVVNDAIDTHCRSLDHLHFKYTSTIGHSSTLLSLDHQLLEAKYCHKNTSNGSFCTGINMIHLYIQKSCKRMIPIMVAVALYAPEPTLTPYHGTYPAKNTYEHVTTMSCRQQHLQLVVTNDRHCPMPILQNE